MSAIAAPPARWWHALENKKVVCRLCPRECHIPVGSRGFCFVRANVEGRLELTTYGRSSGFCIDPVEKKPLNHFLPGTPILSFGTAGCNLGCKFCQNWDISKSREIDTIAHQATPEAIVEAALKTKCRSLAFTYNDPVIWAEYAVDISKVAHSAGLKTVAVTAGYISEEARGEFYEHMDAANVDLKAFTDFFYSKLCQVNLEPILNTLKFLKRETPVWFELTNLMIPGENDSTEETKEMCGWIVQNLGPDVPVHFSAFHPDFKMRDKPPTPPETLVRARQIAIAAGIRYAFVGNVNDMANQSTYCHACGKMLIERDWYELGAYNLRGNACGFCGTIIPGVFDEGGPGKWGRKRLPIAIGQDTRQVITLTSSAKKNASEGTTVPQSGLNIVAAGATGASDVSTAVGTAAPAAISAVAPKIDFTAEQDVQILAHARAIIESSLRGQLFSNVRLPESLEGAPTYGLFVSLFRGGQLRSCKGQWGNGAMGTLAPLGQILAIVARDAASNDPRFPRITLAEMPNLTVEVSLMHSPEFMTARGAERVKSVQVGTHGLVIMHPNGGGLLLPHVAVEANWDSLTFLEALCQKAELPAGTWQQDQARLMTFQARKITDPAPMAELNLAEVGVGGLTQLLAYVTQLLAGRSDAEAGVSNAAQAPFLHRVHAEALGMCLQTASGMNGAMIAPNNSLLSLAKLAAHSLAQNMAQQGRAEPVHRMTLLWQPLTLVTADYPSRHQTLARSTILGQADGRWSLVVPQNDQTDGIGEALKALGITQQQWSEDRAGRIRITAFNALHCHNQAGPMPQSAVPAAIASSNYAASAARGLRMPFWSGQFYPGDPAQARAKVETFLMAGGFNPADARSYRAIMLPHAGWRFCGATMGKTLAGVKVPGVAIIIGPKHTVLGPALSVASHAAWRIGAAEIPVNGAIVQRLCQAISGLACEAEAHRQEHGTEVLLPFLHHLRPDLQIVPMTIGECSPEMLDVLARELAAIQHDAQVQGSEVPLLVISSDMTHFCSEAENRRRDMLALEAMKTGNPQTLYETCIKNNVSMCGLMPAITVMLALQHQTPVVSPRLVDYTTSAQASGDTGRVVGYAGVVIE